MGRRRGQRRDTESHSWPCTEQGRPPVRWGGQSADGGDPGTKGSLRTGDREAVMAGKTGCWPGTRMLAVNTGAGVLSGHEGRHVGPEAGGRGTGEQCLRQGSRCDVRRGKKGCEQLFSTWEE